MLGEGGTPLSRLLAAARDFQAREDRRVDLKGLRAVIDLLEGEFAGEACAMKRSGEQLVAGNISAATWISRICGMSKPSAHDRLCVGEQLESLPLVAEALSKGEISYQSASVICHQREKLGENSDCLDEEMWVGFARKHTIEDLNWIGAHMRYAVDPEGFDRDTEENYEERFLHISQMKGMYHLSGVLDHESGAALKTAIDGLAKRLGQDDTRTPKQRRADAFTEVVYKALDEGKLPRRNGVRPHITITTTLEGLKGELGAAASELEAEIPTSGKDVPAPARGGALGPGPSAGSGGGAAGAGDRVLTPR